MKTLSLWIGVRYAKARSGSVFVGLNSLLSIIGIAIGIAVLIVVLSVMNGVMNQVRDRILSMYSHASIRSFIDVAPINKNFNPEQYLAKFKQVKGFAPYVQGQGLVGKNGQFSPVVIQGIDPNQEIKVSKVFANLPDNIRNKLASNDWNIVIGEGLQKSLDISIGDKLTIIVPQFTASAAGLLPRLKRFTVIGTFKSGHYQFDQSLIWANINNVAKLIDKPDIYTGFHIMLHDPLKAPEFNKELQKILPPELYASDWSQENASYFNAAQLEKNVMFIILCLIVIVAAFGLLSSMYMVVNEKKRAIAILRTMGFTRGQIRQVFLIQGLSFGLLGIIIGVVLGIVVSLYVPEIIDFTQKITGFSLAKDMYFLNQLTVNIDPLVVIGVSLVTLFFTLIFSIIPAQIAAKTEPARALSYE